MRLSDVNIARYADSPSATTRCHC